MLITPDAEDVLLVDVELGLVEEGLVDDVLEDVDALPGKH